MEENQTVSKRSVSKKAISQIVITSMMLAIALCLKGLSELISFFNWPFGGSISLVMVPLVLCSLLCGPIYGTIAGMTFGLFDFLIDGVISWTPNTLAVVLSLILDYLIGFGACGLAGLFKRPFFEKKTWAPLVSMLTCGIVRFISSFISGVVVFTSAFDYSSTSGLSVDFSVAGITYSLTYNLGYMLPTVILSLLVFVLLMRAIYIVLDYPYVKVLAPTNLEVNEEEKEVTLKELIPLCSLILIILSIVGAIPSFKIFYVGIISLVIIFFVLAYSIYLFVNKKIELKQFMIYLGLIIVCVSVSILSIASRYSYGVSLYQ